jgi:hypothetical protein
MKKKEGEKKKKCFHLPNRSKCHVRVIFIYIYI